jgi:hypothetical protein
MNHAQTRNIMIHHALQVWVLHDQEKQAEGRGHNMATITAPRCAFLAYWSHPSPFVSIIYGFLTHCRDRGDSTLHEQPPFRTRAFTSQSAIRGPCHSLKLPVRLAVTGFAEHALEGTCERREPPHSLNDQHYFVSEEASS